MRTPRRLLVLAPAALAVASGCATISPPPMVAALQGASLTPVHSTSVTAFGGASAGIFLETGAGGGARLDHRVSREVAIGVEGLAAARVSGDDGRGYVPDAFFAGRVHAQYNPRASEHLALTFGVGGGGTNNALAFVTADASARISRRWVRGIVEPYAAGIIALSVPTSAPASAVRDTQNDRRYLPAGYLGLDVGLALHATERLEFALDFLLLGGYSASNNLLAGVPTAGVRYTFGG